MRRMTPARFTCRRAPNAASSKTDLAIGYLWRAIEANRKIVPWRTDPDFEQLRSEEAVVALPEGPILPLDGPRRTGLSRSTR